MRLAVLGSTGSIGVSTMRVVRHHPGRFEVFALAARGSQLNRLVAQVEEFRPAYVAVEDESAGKELRQRVGPDTKVSVGAEAVSELAVLDEVERVVAAMVGTAGLGPVAAALSAGKDVALANKEALVVGGPLMMELASASGARVLPVDSEPVALDQALRGGEKEEVRRLILTASGGPFLDRPLDTWGEITPAEALAHPTWSMGRKISIDSATLMNKGLELIEASYLFGVAGEKIDVLIHPQSLIHSMVEFQDGSCLAQLSPNDMVLPIQYALTYPERLPGVAGTLSLAEIGRLEFREVEEERFSTPTLARSALEAGASAPAVLSAANEVAVGAFLEGRIRFLDIVQSVEAVLSDHQPTAVGSIEEALHWDDWGRRRAMERLS